MTSEPACSSSDSAADRTGIVIRPLQAADERAATEALRRVFELTIDTPLLQPGAWHRRYFENPAGTRATIAVDEAGRILAQYAGLPQGAWLDGERATFTQGVDSLAEPDRGRGGLGSLFVRVGRQFADDYGARRGSGDPFMWGYPVREAWRIGRAMLGYETIRSQLSLVAGIEELVQGDSADVQLVEVAEFPSALDAWFDAHRRRYAAICDRTAAALEWRYTGSQGREYRIALACRGDALLGLVVGRAVEIEGRRRFALCEWLVEPDARAAMLDWAIAAARESATDELYLWVPPWTDDFLALQVAGFRVHPTSRVLVGRSYDKRWAPEWFADNWFMTLGDTDLV